MEHSTRLAHISEDGTRTQTVYDHLRRHCQAGRFFSQSPSRRRVRPNLPRGSTTSASTAMPS